MLKRKHLQHTTYILMAILLVLAFLLSACGKTDAPVGDAALAPVSSLPQEMQAAPVNVREAYQFALANPEILEQVPCYCGCDAIGHTSNFDCYIDEIGADGNAAFDAHALGCSICVDITHDVMRMLKDGNSVEQIRSTIDQTYAQFGPSNMPPAP
jgi:hypothetical protein